MKLDIKKPIHDASIFAYGLKKLDNTLGVDSHRIYFIGRNGTFDDMFKLSRCDITYENNTIVLNLYVFGLISMGLFHLFSTKSQARFQKLVQIYLNDLSRSGLKIDEITLPKFYNAGAVNKFFEMLEANPKAKFQIKLWKCMKNNDLKDFIDITDQLSSISAESDIAKANPALFLNLKLKGEAANLLTKFKNWMKIKLKNKDPESTDADDPMSEYF